MGILGSVGFASGLHLLSPPLEYCIGWRIWIIQCNRQVCKVLYHIIHRQLEGISQDIIEFMKGEIGQSCLLGLDTISILYRNALILRGNGTLPRGPTKDIAVSAAFLIPI